MPGCGGVRFCRVHCTRQTGTSDRVRKFADSPLLLEIPRHAPLSKISVFGTDHSPPEPLQSPRARGRVIRRPPTIKGRVDSRSAQLLLCSASDERARVWSPRNTIRTHTHTRIHTLVNQMSQRFKTGMSTKKYFFFFNFYIFFFFLQRVIENPSRKQSVSRCIRVRVCVCACVCVCIKLFISRVFFLYSRRAREGWLECPKRVSRVGTPVRVYVYTHTHTSASFLYTTTKWGKKNAIYK